MLTAQKYLELVRARGKAKKELKRVYRGIRNRELFLISYANRYSNKGALTPGTDPQDTVDEMSLKRLDAILKRLGEGTYRWKPVKRTYIEKRHSMKLRPVGMPSWNDKLVQDVIKMVLEAYYEPQFRDSSHGFRPGRGCHTALTDVYYTWKGIKWFIEGDIKGCFDSIDGEKLLEIIGKQVKDERLLKLVRDMLHAGYVEDWTYHKTYSGTPQGGILSPLLANIMLNELDIFVEDYLIPKYTKGDKRKRKWNPEYQKLNQRAVRAKKRGDRKAHQRAVNEKRNVPVFLDDGCTWLKYVRYADDFLLGFAGSRREAEEIKGEIGAFLNTLKLEMSEEKTLLTNAREGKARFLNYHIGVIWNSKVTPCGKGKGQAGNGGIFLSVPNDVVHEWIHRVTRATKIVHNASWRNNSDYDIIMAYETQVQGLINYYTFAHDVNKKMGTVRYAYERSLVKTLAAKHQCSSMKIWRKYTRYTADGRKVIAVEVTRKDKKPLVASYGKKPIRQNRDATIHDGIHTAGTTRTEFLERLLNETCELCGARVGIEGHHIRKLKDLRRRYEGKKEPPEWVKRMIAIHRKTLFVCQQCHRDIHYGRYDGARLA